MDSDEIKVSQTEKLSSDGPSWLEVGAVVLSAAGVVTSLGWLYQPGRDLSSISTYFDPWYQSLITLALLGLGLALSCLSGFVEQKPEGSRWVRWSRLLALCGVGMAVLFVVVVPIVIWVVTVLIWAIKVIYVALGILAVYNLKRLERGQRLYWPRSPEAMARWLFKAVERVPFGG